MIALESNSSECNPRRKAFSNHSSGEFLLKRNPYDVIVVRMLLVMNIRMSNVERPLAVA